VAQLLQRREAGQLAQFVQPRDEGPLRRGTVFFAHRSKPELMINDLCDVSGTSWH
jgi:hypothetical protein